MYNSNCNRNEYFDYTFNNTNTNMFHYSNNNPFPNNYLYGHAYTPNQKMNKTFTPENALKNGTLFPELVSPYEPYQSIDFINFLRNGGR